MFLSKIKSVSNRSLLVALAVGLVTYASISSAEASRSGVHANCAPLVVTGIKTVNSSLSRPDEYRLWINGDINVMSQNSYGPTVPNWKKSMIAIYYQVNNESGRMIKKKQFTVDHLMRAWSKKSFTAGPITLPRTPNHTLKVVAQVHNYECQKIPGARGNMVYPVTTSKFDLRSMNQERYANKPRRIGRVHHTY